MQLFYWRNLARWNIMACHGSDVLFWKSELISFISDKLEGPYELWYHGLRSQQLIVQTTFNWQVVFEFETVCHIRFPGQHFDQRSPYKDQRLSDAHHVFLVPQWSLALKPHDNRPGCGLQASLTFPIELPCYFCSTKLAQSESMSNDNETSPVKGIRKRRPSDPMRIQCM